jgi:DNA-binding NarL/FixJ family response regulator
MNDQPNIVLASNSSTRRARLSDLLRKKVKHGTLQMVSSVSLSQAYLEHAGADVLIADVDSPSAAAQAVRVLRASARIGVVALIDSPDPSWVQEALDVGMNAIISRDPDADELHLAFAAAEAGLVLLDPSWVRNLAARNLTHSSESDDVEPLTPRECQVLRLISEGLANKEIAARLEISEHTAKFHISSILGKLGVSSRTEAVSDGIRKGLIPI